MLTYIVRRIVYSVPVLVIASFFVFWGIRTTYDPTAKLRTSRDATRVIAERRHQLGLDRSILRQWWSWFTGFLHGDLGISDRTNGRVWGMLTHAMWPSLQLMFFGIGFALVLAIAVGVYSAVKQYSVGDYVFTGVSYIGIAMPTFLFGLLAIALVVTLPVTKFHLTHPILFSVGLHSTGQSGFNLDYIRHLVLPVLTLTVQSVAVWSRFQRASMLDVLNADYVRTARAKGVPRRKVIFGHAFRNALIPLVTVVALDSAFLVGGLVITEQIFSIFGMGRLFLEALSGGDAPVLLGWFLIVAVFVIVFNLIADIMYSVLDPRIRVCMTVIPENEIVGSDTELELAPGAEPVARTNWQLFRRRFFRHKLALFSMVVLVLLILACFGASWIAPFPKNETNLLIIPGGPSAHHWFGTNQAGQDMLTQVLYGGQISLKIGLAVAFFSTVVGVIVGAMAGFYGGWIDQGLSRFTDLFLIVPELAILGVAIQRLGRSDNAFIIVLAALGWMYIARVVRGQVLSLKEKEFIEAARASGASGTRIIVRHILPNCIGPIMVNATLAIAAAVIAETTLTYLGLGLQPPATSWGILLNQAEGAVTSTSQFYLVFFPGLFLILTVLAVNFLGDGLRDAFDPQSSH